MVSLRTLSIRFVRFDESEVLSVPLGDLSRAINTDHVAVKRADLRHNTCLVPLSWFVSMLFLDKNMVSNMKGVEESGAPR